MILLRNSRTLKVRVGQGILFWILQFPEPSYFISLVRFFVVLIFSSAKPNILLTQWEWNTNH